MLGQASKQQLENEFGTSKDVDVVLKILEKGKDQPSDAIGTQMRGLNDSRGGAYIDNKGSGKGTSGI